jgi:4-amino-4-deoxy-L-arabinose transferase-like glycosyltransferase
VVARPRLRRLAVSEGAGIFWLLLAGYLAVAIFLVFGANIIQGDALSRVGSATYILYSRDPHLAAIGFVWSPLPSLLMLPLLPFRIIFPQLVALGFASNIVSAVCMAGAVYQVWRILLDLRVTRTWRLLLTLLFALHPMIVFYGANGMSEAPFLFFLLLTVRYLAAWIHTSRIEWQVYAGLALGGAYLCRYEAIPAGVGALCVVTLVSWLRGKANRERRLVTALCDAAIVGAPFLLAVAVWAIASYVIVGHPFEQLASIYGNDSQMRTLAPGRQTTDLLQVLLQLVILEPFLLAAVALGALKAARLRDLRALAILGILAPVLVFAVWAHLNGAVAPWLRYLIVAIPLGVLMAGIAFGEAEAHPPLVTTWLRKGLRRTGRVAIVTSLATAVVVSAVAMTDQSIAPEEGHELSYLTTGGRLTPDQQRAADRFVTERAVAADLDRRHLAKGSVLVDTFLGYPIVLSSRHPDQFVITSDRDFRQAIADPSGTGVDYILVPSQTGLGNLDAINQTYKAMYSSGAGMGVLLQEFRNVGDGADWRLYGVTSSR